MESPIFESPIFVASYALLWLLVVVSLGGLFVLFRHLGTQLLESNRAGHALQGPVLNKRLEPHEYDDVRGNTVGIGGTGRKPQIVLFGALKCRPCRQLMQPLAEFVRRYSASVEVTYVCHGDSSAVNDLADSVPPELRLIADEERSVTVAHYIMVTPYALSIDAGGVLRAKGVPGLNLASLEEIRTRLLNPDAEDIDSSPLNAPMQPTT